MQVTITHLPVTLSLLHIPRSRVAHLTHPIIKQLLHKNPAYLSLICNEIELTVFAEEHLLADFESIARLDSQKSRRPGSSNLHVDQIELSYIKWTVFQVDSHADQPDSLSRVQDISAPLAAAGISIMYQSTYMSDFLLVRTSSLAEVIQLLRTAGFDLYSSSESTSSPAHSRLTSPILNSVASGMFDEVSGPFDLDGPLSSTVLTRSRSSTESSAPKSNNEPLVDSTTPPAQTLSMTKVNAKSASPAAGQVSVLAPDIACVGLVDDYVDTWTLKLIRLIAYPELLLPAPNPHPSQNVPLAHSIIERGRTKPSSSASSVSSTESDPNGYFSDLSRSARDQSTSSISSMASRSNPDLTSSLITSAPKSNHVPSATKITPLTPISPTVHATGSIPRASSTIPFFSFTRTAEGSSLTTCVSTLAQLFPPEERHILICQEELLSPPAAALSTSEEAAVDQQNGVLKCLQIDLARFGLDKHGLVNRYARVLEDAGITHMYSSTYKTANLLVEKAEAERAQMLLQNC